MAKRSRWRTAAGVGVLVAAGSLGYSHIVAQGGGARPASAGQIATSRAPVPPTQLGMNLGNPTYWSSEWAFADIVQTSGGILLQTPEGKWELPGDRVRLDTGGHPIDVPLGTRLNIMIQKDSPRIPTGVFDCRIPKGWAIRPFGDWQLSGLSGSAGGQKFRMTVPKAESRNGIVLLLTATADKAALTGLSCVPSAGASGTFNPTFLADLKPFGVLRYMDWMRTNFAPLRTWTERPTPGAFSQSGPQGAAIEHMVALANTLGSDPWFNLPMDTDPGYYRAMATYVRDHLAPGRRAYVELSNEVWNTGFGQGKDASARGAKLYPSATLSEQNDFYYADRVRDAMRQWSEVFAGQEKRLVRVLASQQVNPRRAEQALSHKDTWRFVDALATAPYFGTNGAEFPTQGVARVDAIFARGSQLVDAVIAESRANKAIAARYGLRYIAYEGGAGFNHPRPDLRIDTLAAQRDPRMRDLYAMFLRRWKAEIGDVLVLYNSVSTPGPTGYYGHREYTGQPLNQAPKAAALAEFAGD